jgi:hypothetical protein
MKAEAIDAAIEAMRSELKSLRMKRCLDRKINLLEQASMRESYYRRMEALKRKHRYLPLHAYSDALNEVYGQDMNSPIILSQQAKLCRALHQSEILKQQINCLKDFALEEAKISQSIVSQMADERTSTETKLISQIMLLSNEIADLKSRYNDAFSSESTSTVIENPAGNFKTNTQFPLAPLVSESTDSVLPQRMVCAAYAG